ncbi:MAG: hypothetical protein WBO04_10020 [Steroidobacteraceae bacterium]
MDDRIARLESTMARLGSAVESLQRRVELLEALSSGTADAAVDAGAGEASREPPKPPPASLARRDPYDPIVVLSLIGRLFLVLAGGFFLRAMTEAGVLAAEIGVGLAFVYGLAWLVLADRAGRRGQVTSAVFHALAAALVAFPLLVEATTRFKVLTGAGGALGLALLTVGLFLVAWRQRLRAIAWVTIVAALPTSLVLLVEAGVVVPIGLYLVALGVATLWLGYALGWTALRWPVALTADIVVAGVTMRALAPGHLVVPHVAMLLQWALIGAYLVSVAIRTFVRGRSVTPFEIVQTAAALLVGFGGTVFLTRANGSIPAAVGLTSVVLGATCYGVARVFIGRRADLERNLYFYTSLALVLVLAGCALALRAQWLGVVFAVLGAAATAAWSREGRPYLLLHGAIYIVAASIASGALGYSAWALLSAPVEAWAVPRAIMLVVLIAAASSAGLAAARPRPDDAVLASGLKLVLALCVVVLASGWLIGNLALVAAGPADRRVDLGALATVRTIVLAVAALVIAWIGRHSRFREWAWLVYPLLVAVGLKMVAQDFNYSRPATLFIALAVYGAALIVAPRLRRGGPAAHVRNTPAQIP